MLGGIFSAGIRIGWTVLWVSLIAGAQAAIQAETPTLPETMTEDNVMQFVEEHDISTVEAFVAALPPLHKQFYVSMFGSQSPAADFISTSHPRIVSWGADARFILTWTVNPDDPLTNTVEFLQSLPEEGRWSAGVIDFGTDPPELSHPTTCASCHSSINKPLWGRYDSHKGTELEREHRENQSADEEALYNTMATTTDPRLTPLERDGYQTKRRGFKFSFRRDLQLPNWEFDTVIALRHAEVLFSRLRARENYDSLVETVMCGGDGQPDNLRERVIAQFSQELYNPRLLSDSLEPVQGENEFPGRVQHDYDLLSFEIAFLALRDLYLNDEGVAELYRQTSNEDVYDVKDSAFGGRGPLLRRYAKGTATAEDELLAAYREFFELSGQASIDYRARRGVDPRYGTKFIKVHALLFANHVCGILRGPLLTASFTNVPTSHDGESVFSFQLEFSEEVEVSYKTLEDEAFEVTGGTVEGANRRQKGSNQHWDIRITPDSDGPVTITLPETTDCDTAGAICTGGKTPKPLSNSPLITVVGPAVEPLTASFTSVPDSHDGSTIFTFNLSFTEPVAVSFEVLRDQALSTSNGNGNVRKCHRVDGRNDLWEVHIEPNSNADITVSLSSPSTNCDDANAVCTAADKLLSNEPSVTIAGSSAKVVAASKPPGLLPNAPNPFNASTLIPYRLVTPGAVRLEIYNLLGQPVRTLVDQFQDAGSYRVPWDARDQGGATVAAGVYIVRLHYPGGVQTQRLLYLK